MFSSFRVSDTLLARAVSFDFDGALLVEPRAE